jgi:energy-coupling factor transport system ATP-binding protein
MSTVLAVSNLWWRYPTFSDQLYPWILRNISLQVEQGECFGITGPGGAGKTTLCRTLIGILPHSTRLTKEQLPHHFRGTIELMGEAVTAQSTSSKRIGMVMQDPDNQFLRMSLLHELGLGLQIQGVPHDQILQRAYDALSRVGLAHLWHGSAYIHPADLSGGQKQRVAIAAFLALRPQILILDEPTSDLDPSGKRAVIETIASLRRDHHMTVILIEQDPEILSAFCDRVALLYEGRIELVAPPADFYAERAVLERCGAAVGELTRISWQTGYGYKSRPPVTLEEAVSAFSPIVSHLSASPAAQEQEETERRERAIQAEQIVYRYDDGTMALKGVDLTLYRGEMLALLGPNGSGKTTLAKILAGIYRPERGRVLLSEQDLADKRVRKRLLHLVGYIFQNPDHQLFCREVSDEIEYGLKNLGIAPAQRREKVTATLEAVGLTQYANEDPLFLSKGQRQRLAVAAVLAMGPDILIVDEPTTGQDARSIASIMGLLCELQRQGKTILIITHDMTLVVEYCQRVVAFRDGLVAFTGTPTELFSNQEVLRRTGLRAPMSATLTARLRQQKADLPSLMTVRQWTEALRSSL